MFTQQAIDSAVQVAVFAVIALLVWAVSARKRAGFVRWAGLYPPTSRSMLAAVVLFAVFNAVTLPLIYGSGLKEIAQGEGTVGASFAGQGLSAELVGTVLLVAFVKTALSEEILFRGVLGKRLINALGFWAGNTLQAVIFGAVHIVPFMLILGDQMTPLQAALVFLVPGTAGWVMGFANEKGGNGSIWPGWLIHGLGNTVSNLLFAAA